MQVRSFVAGAWRAGCGTPALLRDATTGEVVGETSAEGIEGRAMLEHARSIGGPNLRRLTFHERASRLKALARLLSEHKQELYSLSFATGATRADSWIDIDGGIGTLFTYASKGQRELPDGHVYVEGAAESLSKRGTFLGQHICVPREGAAIQINAFNFPVWGMLEKLAAALLAGMPAIVKPATATCFLTERAFAYIVESGILPPGAVQLICGGASDLLDHLICQDVVSFTGSGTTARKLQRHPRILDQAVRFIAETDSLNSSILGPDAAPGTPELDLYVREVVREMTVKAGQKCTAIRKAIVPAEHLPALCEALRSAIGSVLVGDPRLESVAMGPLASLEQRREVLKQLRKLEQEAQVVTGGRASRALEGADGDRGAFVAPTLLSCRDPDAARAVHTVEAFGPICTIMSYRDLDEAIALARRGGGSLVGSVFTGDESVAATLVLGLAPLHGRVLVVDRHCAAESTGHGSPLPHLVHGGPGRAGGGEEMGGIRGVLHYMQRTALQGSADVISVVTRRYTRGARELDPGKHPFRKSYHELRVGDTFRSAAREVTLDDVEAFAALTGDRFYAHMDEAAARRNPLFGGRVAHGYFLVSAAAGLFVEPEFGPVLANYGLEGLKFLKPVKPGDRIRVRLTCMEKSLRADKGYGEVRWDTEITNQAGEPVAVYEVLTLVSEEAPAAER
ncbi:MAG: phenylacetic acid degradation bifunctional protein PaaZ [Steroidobacteraceae bacterium]